jgi:hypothetical protein
MATSYTSLLGLALPVTGELSGTWGDTVNNYITSYVDAAVEGTQTISGSQTAVTLSTTNGSSLSQAGSGATGSAQYAVINCTGNPAGLLTVTVPASSRNYIVINATSTSQSVKIVGVGPTTGVTLVSGEKAIVAWNGSDFVKAASTVITNFTGTLGVANGGTGLTSGTSGGVLAFTASGTIASSGALAANALVIGGGAGAAPATTTTGTGVVTAVGNAVNTTGGLVTQSGTLAASAILLGGGASTAISSTTTGTGVVTALGNNANATGGLVTVDGTATLTNKTITNLVFSGNYTEGVYAIVDGASVDLNPANGTIQTWTLGASRSPTATGFSAGQSMTLMVDDGTAYTITWPSVTWVNNAGAAPTLATSGYTVIALWKVSTTLYGALVGNGT